MSAEVNTITTTEAVKPAKVSATESEKTTEAPATPRKTLSNSIPPAVNPPNAPTKKSKNSKASKSFEESAKDLHEQAEKNKEHGGFNWLDLEPASKHPSTDSASAGSPKKASSAEQQVKPETTVSEQSVASKEVVQGQSDDTGWIEPKVRGTKKANPSGDEKSNSEAIDFEETVSDQFDEPDLCKYADHCWVLKKQKSKKPLNQDDIDHLGKYAHEDLPDFSVRTERPYLYKTILCHHFKNGNCNNGSKCTYAHGLHELRSPSNRKPFPSPLSIQKAQAQREPIVQKLVQRPAPSGTVPSLHSADVSVETKVPVPSAPVATGSVWGIQPSKQSSQTATIAERSTVVKETPAPKTWKGQEVQEFVSSSTTTTTSVGVLVKQPQPQPLHSNQTPFAIGGVFMTGADGIQIYVDTRDPQKTGMGTITIVYN